MWSEITTKANALCDAPITLKEVKDKWRNLTVKAKSTFTEYRKDANKTGGGLAPKKPTSSVQDTRFSCIEGLDTTGYTNEQNGILVMVF
jgi:hypothetical protein